MIKSGTFLSRSGTGAQAITGLGFQPTGLVVWSVLQGAAGFAEQMNHVLGIADAAGTRASHSDVQFDHPVPPGSLIAKLVNTVTTVTPGNASVINWSDVSGVVQQAATVAFTADGFTLTWTTNAFSNVTYGYLAFGAPVTCKVVLGTVPASTGAQAYTGLGFAPTALLGWVGSLATSGYATSSLGLAAGPSQQAHLIGYTRFSPQNDPGDEVRLLLIGAFVTRMVGAGVIDARANLQSLDANGFTLTWTQVAAPAGGAVPMLALGGVSAAVDVFAQPAVTGAQAVASPIMPEALVLLSANAVASGSTSRAQRNSIGVVTAANQYGTWGGTVDQYFDIPNNKYFSQSTRGASTKGLFFATGLAGTPFGTTNAEATVALTGTGFTNTWTTVDATPRAVAYLSLGALAIPLAITTLALPAATSGTVYSQTIAATGGTTPYTFSLVSGTLPPGLSLASNGTLSGTPPALGTIAPTSLPAAAAGVPYTQPLTVINTEGSATFTVRVTDASAATDDQVYTVAVTGTGPYTYALVSGSLPPGLTLAANGLVSGTAPATPTAIVPFPLPNGLVDTLYTQQLAVTNPTVSYAFTVRATIGTVSPPDRAYTLALTAVSGTATFAVVLGALPKCLTLTLTGLLKGMPMQVGTATFTIRATDSAGATTDRVFTLTSVS